MPEQNSVLVGRDPSSIARAVQTDADGNLIVGGSVVPVPAVDSVANAYAQDVTGNKADAASSTAGTASLIALARYIISELSDIEDEVEEIDQQRNQRHRGKCGYTIYRHERQR
jgi:hypothetical protein